MHESNVHNCKKWKQIDTIWIITTIIVLMTINNHSIITKNWMKADVVLLTEAWGILQTCRMSTEGGSSNICTQMRVREHCGVWNTCQPVPFGNIFGIKSSESWRYERTQETHVGTHLRIYINEGEVGRMFQSVNSLTCCLTWLPCECEWTLLPSLNN